VIGYFLHAPLEASISPGTQKSYEDLVSLVNQQILAARSGSTIYASLGDTDQAMSWLEKGFEERFNPGVLLRPGFDPLRSDSRF
jgi:hypothetical protein